MTGSGSTTRRSRRWWTVPMLAVLTTAGVSLAPASSAGGAGTPTTVAEDPMVTETRKLVERFIQLWNENKLDEMAAGHFTEDAMALPPNHEPIHGRTAIVAYYKSLRDAVGEFDKGDHLIRATASGDNSVSWVGQYSFHDGTVRATSHELYVRQPDGSMRCAVDMFGYRDPLS